MSTTVKVNLRKSPLPYQKYLILQKRLRQRRQELLLFCSHPPVITYGRQAVAKNLLVDVQGLHQKGIDCHAVNRGGDFTAHEMGQCVIYTHIDLRKRGIKLSPFAQKTIDITKQVLEKVWPQLDLVYRSDAPGLYLQNPHEKTDKTDKTEANEKNGKNKANEKLVAMGYSFEKFFSSHGIAINIDNDLNTFQYIHPCGYQDVRPTSLRQLRLPVSVARLQTFHQLWQDELQDWLQQVSL